jgi:hypothetical protein
MRRGYRETEGKPTGETAEPTPSRDREPNAAKKKEARLAARFFVVGPERIELSTSGLRVHCSAN